MKFRPLYFLLSGALLAVSVFSIVKWGFNPSIDFVGGTVIEYAFTKTVDVNQVAEALKDSDVQHLAVVQNIVTVRTKPISQEESQNLIAPKLQEKLGEEPQVLRFENVGPTLSAEILKRTLIAIGIATLGILLWVAWQFRNLKFGISAILAMLHDTGILLGFISLAGNFLNVEIDLLLVTAVLTTLSFSVHDTIVVYDRIREIQRKSGGQLIDIANVAISETMVRSLNNSLTIIFMLVALALLGGVTIKWFVLALLLGTILGTYSSPFVAVPLLVTWGQLQKRLKK